MANPPPNSPRLPSPPPPAEIQIGPKSPSMNSAASQQAQQMEQTAFDANARRRVHPGTKGGDMAAGPPLVPLNELDSAFQLQEHLAALHYYHSLSHTQPITRGTAKTLATPPPSIDRTLWLYELCRFLVAQCNSLIVGFLFDTPPCSATTCPEMRASEWQFLCAVHDAPKSCCAIDYCCHTLDWAANVVTNPKIFPSRFVVLSDAHDKGAALKNLVNVFRRLHRIFAHAWFQHRGVFWSVEAQTGLYVFFKTVCDLYDLLPAENYKLPPEAEGLEPAVANGSLEASAERNQRQQEHPVPAAVLRPPQHAAEGEDDNFQPIGRTSTRRHIRSNPSVGSAVTTVPEADEDESAAFANRLQEMHISTPPETVEEEPEVADVPVIVEHDMIDVTPQALKVPDEGLPIRSAPAANAAGEQKAAEVPAASEPPGPEQAHGDDGDLPPKPEAESREGVATLGEVEAEEGDETIVEVPTSNEREPELKFTSVHDFAAEAPAASAQGDEPADAEKPSGET